MTGIICLNARGKPLGRDFVNATVGIISRLILLPLRLTVETATLKGAVERVMLATQDNLTSRASKF